MAATFDPYSPRPVMSSDANSVLEQLFQTLESRRQASAEQSYTAQLFAKGTDAILKKLAEEAGETLIAAKNTDDGELVHELADLWYHAMVLMVHRGLPMRALTDELAGRMHRSGLEEKAARSRPED